MEQKLFLLIAIILLAFPVSAQNIEVEKTEISPVIIVELGNPITYELEITNLGETDTFEISSLAGFEITPNEIEISTNQTRTIIINAQPSESRLRTTRGEFVFDYKIRSSSETYTDKLRVKMVELERIFEIEVQDINPQSTHASVIVENNEKIDLNDITLMADSPFFEDEQTFSLPEYSKTTLSIELDEQQRDKLVAGNYIADFEIQVEDATADLEVSFSYLEEEGLALSESSEGFIVRETQIIRENTGNTPVTATTSHSVNAFSRLFTTLSPKPSQTERQGFFVDYTWEKDLAPGESLDVNIKTNYTFPFILILIIIGIVIAVKFYLETNLRVKKHVSLVKTKGEEFAMRVRLSVKAKKTVKDIELTDRIPTMTKLYDKFGIKPDVIDPKTRKLQWKIKHLNAGEERVFSYIIYSKIKVMGRFDLPAAFATYEMDGKKMQSYSNKTSLATETTERTPQAQDFI